MTEFYNQYFCGEINMFSVIVEDDGRVAYAYLMKHTTIVGDVWLYNQEKAPDQIDWNNKELTPFLNPKEYVGENIQPVRFSEEITPEWSLTKEKRLYFVSIIINNKLIAKLSEESKPGWSSLVVKNGPLAKIL